MFLDVEMEDVVRPAATHELRAGWGTKVVVTLGPAVSGGGGCVFVGERVCARERKCVSMGRSVLEE